MDVIAKVRDFMFPDYDLALVPSIAEIQASEELTHQAAILRETMDKRKSDTGRRRILNTKVDRITENIHRVINEGKPLDERNHR